MKQKNVIEKWTMDGTATELVQSDPLLTKEEVEGAKIVRKEEDVPQSTSYAQVRR